MAQPTPTPTPPGSSPSWQTVGLWGPPARPTRVDGNGPVSLTPRWGLGDLAWALFWFVAAQVLLVAALTAVAVIQLFPPGHPVTGADAAAILTRVGVLAHSGPGMAVGLLSEWVVFVGVPVWVTVRKGRRSLAADFGYRIRWPHDVALGVAIAVAANLVFEAVTVVLHAAHVNLAGSTNTGLVSSAGGRWVYVMAAAAGFAAPFVEELFFRGLFLHALLNRFRRPPPPAATSRLRRVGRIFTGPPGRLVRRYPGVFAALISGTVFGVAHAQGGGVGGLFLLAQTTTLGVVFGLVAVRVGRVGPTICAHLANNLFVVGVVLWTLSHR